MPRNKKKEVSAQKNKIKSKSIEKKEVEYVAYKWKEKWPTNFKNSGNDGKREIKSGTVE